MRKLNMFIIGLFLFILIGGCSDKNGIASKYCEKNSDCITTVQLNSECSHYCQGQECTDELIICDAFYKDSEGNKGLADIKCKNSVPCKQPSNIECKNNVCVVS